RGRRVVAGSGDASGGGAPSGDPRSGCAGPRRSQVTLRRRIRGEVMADRDAEEFPRGRTPEGEPVSCVEKIKVLNENLAELRALAQDALEDAVLMGADERQRGRGARR